MNNICKVLGFSTLVVAAFASDLLTDCNDAPNDTIRTACQFIQKWDVQSRIARPMPRAKSGRPVHSIYDCMDIACMCPFLGGTGGKKCVLRSGKKLTRAYRKEYRVLTRDERKRYHDAMWAIKRNGKYDDLSRIHSQFRTSPGAHSGPGFLTWHREYTKRLEFALRQVDPELALPYWDSSLDNAIPDPRFSSLWSDELMGSTDERGLIATGAFKGWRTVDGSRVFMRNVGARGQLFTAEYIDLITNYPDITQILAFTAPHQGCHYPAGWLALEYVHGGPHIYVGGDMLNIPFSTNDPLFFNHHSMVDLIWELWRERQQTRTERETRYPSDNPRCSSHYHYANATMIPFYGFTNYNGLSNEYTDNLYEYAPRPTCSYQNRNGCGSEYLFCDLSNGRPRCAAKIMVRGYCGGYYYGEDMCYNGRCSSHHYCVEDSKPKPPLTTTTLRTTKPQTTKNRKTQVTTRPPKTSRKPSAKEESCFNENKCCEAWKNRNQCNVNPTYMELYCMPSCGRCTPTTYILRDGCEDRHRKCNRWKREGECHRNAEWMSENCRKACQLCGIPRERGC